MKNKEIMYNLEKCWEYVREINGLVGAVDNNAIDQIKKLLQTFYHYHHLAQKYKDLLTWLIEFSHIDEEVIGYVKNEIRRIEREEV